MARQAKLLPARGQPDEPWEEGSTLPRSAESIGRVIGTLQRQLDSARNRLATAGMNGNRRSRTHHDSRRKLETGQARGTGSTRGARANDISRTSSTSESDSKSRSTRNVTRGPTA